jgi:hypothetical protein
MSVHMSKSSGASFFAGEALVVAPVHEELDCLGVFGLQDDCAGFGLFEATCQSSAEVGRVRDQ